MTDITSLIHKLKVRLRLELESTTLSQRLRDIAAFHYHELEYLEEDIAQQQARNYERLQRIMAAIDPEAVVRARQSTSGT